MSLTRYLTIAAAFLAAILLFLPGKGWAAELPEGVDVQVMAEYAVDIPNVEKVELRRIVLEPGATLANIPINDQVFCTATQGVISVVDHTDGSTTMYATGSRWAPGKGHTFTLTNPGDVTHEHWVYAIIEKK